VRVVVRVRPQLREDEAAWREVVGATRAISYGSCVNVDSEVSLTTKRIEFAEERTWHFDHVLGCNTTQDEAFSAIARSATADVVSGFSHTILAYGQTGSGKSHTVFGPESFWSQYDGSSGPASLKCAGGVSEPCLKDSSGGIVGRAVAHMFRFVAAADAGDCFRVLVSFFEIYNESVHDLLGDSCKSLNVRENKECGVFVESLRRVAATSSHELLSVVAEGVSRRTLSATAMNRASSRSHAFLVITFDHKRSKDDASVQPPPPITRGVFTVVDLAGSERVAKSGSVGSTLAEAKSINKSLTTLGMCIAALSNHRPGGASAASRSSPHVPLRDSKLTRLLTDTLEGRTRTTLVVTVSPMAHNFEETKSSLQLAQRAMGVQCSSSVSFVPQDGADAGDARLQKRVLELEQENEALRRQVQQLLLREAPGKFVDAAVQHTFSVDREEGGSRWDGDCSAIPAPLMRIVDQREAAIVSKLGAVIQHLQQEIARSTSGANSAYAQEHCDVNKF
jgi:kinesin family member 5